MKAVEPAAQAADVPLVDAEDEEDDADAGAADDFVSDDVEELVEDDPEPEVFEAEAGVLLEEEPRLSFR